MARRAAKTKRSRKVSSRTKTARAELVGRAPAPKNGDRLIAGQAQPGNPAPDYTRAGRRLDAVPDRVDIRDWFYQPRLTPLPDKIVNCERVPLILDQGQEGACTGFALAAVINFVRADQFQRESVSPRMLYEMARRYDEWPGESYEGSSARGAMKGWVRHGVCLDKTWPATLHGPKHLTPERADKARGIPGGAFYRVSHRQVRDVHSALAEVGILYMTLMVHDGWDGPGGACEVHYTLAGHARVIRLPVIERKGRADSGHAVAIVGYTEKGFIIQNSWGPGWGERGFALLPYEDYMLHATDVWVAQVGVPVEIDLWQKGMADNTSGLQRASAVIPLNDIRPYTIDIGNNGKLSDSGDYWTTPEDVKRLFHETIPDTTKTWKRRRVLLYLHGGLNPEGDVARRVVAFRDKMLANEIYPLHIMWETGLGDTLRGLLEDILKGEEARAGDVADWLKRTRDGLIEAKDWSLEMTASIPGTIAWDKMKENADAAAKRGGGMTLVAENVAHALAEGGADEHKKWEVHVVGHSAGSIFAAYCLPLLLKLNLDFKTLQFLAPAITLELFRDTMVPSLQQAKCPKPDLYILSDKAEQDDNVFRVYSKSLLYLISNAFEGKRGTPLLGMERYVRKGVDAKAAADGADVIKLLNGRIVVAGVKDGPLRSSSTSHGGFDNDPETMNSVMRRILGEEPKKKFCERDLQF